jgi:hypothetical protein
MQHRKNISDGQRLSGHANGSSEYPEILVYDGVGHGDGSCLFEIASFHWADVRVSGDTTLLSFENKVEVAITDGVIVYRNNNE